MKLFKKLIICCAFLAVVLSGCGNSDYANNVEQAKNEIMAGIDSSLQICQAYSQTWSAAIDNGNDFNLAISNMKDSLADGKAFDALKNIDTSINKSMKNLSNPPSDYSNAHDKLVELYGVYSEIHSLALNPTGSLLSFNQKVNNLVSKSTSLSSEITVLLPRK